MIHQGIPTLYKSIRFRSRIEAKHAAFFDLLGWPWEYEPIDLAGYIPDFILTFPKQILVEVKATLEFKDLRDHTAKIEASGWDKESLIVGGRLFRSEASAENIFEGSTYLGLMSERVNFETDPEILKILPDGFVRAKRSYWDGARMLGCEDGGFSFHHDYCHWGCRRGCEGYQCWRHNGSEIELRTVLDRLWAEAGNEVQWKGRKTA